VTATGQDFTAVWRRALEALDVAGIGPNQRAFIRLTKPIGLIDGMALLAAPDDFTRDILEQRLRDPITEALSAELGMPIKLAVMVDPAIAGPSDDEASAHDRTSSTIDVREALPRETARGRRFARRHLRIGAGTPRAPLGSRTSGPLRAPHLRGQPA
jgi:chromosomal replication initiation ATPase DnaA